MKSGSNINLAVTFDATALTEPISALEIAEKVRLFLAIELDAANVRVEVHGAALDFRANYEVRKVAFGKAAKDGLN